MDAVLVYWPFLAGALLLIFLISIPLFLRVVVETNQVHIVQSANETTSYGTGQKDGNVYYKWPSWLPVLGVSRIPLPVSNFDLSLDGYVAYDKDKVPFELDVTAFFRISDTNLAAQRISSVAELTEQLEIIVKGAVRKILGSHDIEKIMTDRTTFGDQFSEEVKNELANWGVAPVKNMELMDIRDTSTGHAIADIQAKKSSHIASESRIEVAKNEQAALTAEIEAKREVDIRKQEAEKQVGERTADKEKAVGIANEKALQDVKSQQAITAGKQMEVARVNQVKQAEIDKDARLVTAEQEKQVAIRDAEGKLEATKLGAQGIEAEGKAKAAAEQALLLAPVEAQIKLAKEIGENPEYQQYLVLLEALKAYIQVGGEQAKALQGADVKIIANAGNPSGGLKNAMQLFSAEGGLSVASMLEAFVNTPKGAELFEGLKKLTSGSAAEAVAEAA